ncbi:exosortase A-associated hydrolase 1 [Rheinheimera pacifica]|uniref:hydrolase 1, exosortase A system-associated n=1 Tax=Rheinheimera pacifica TaxID=173990 RepID=UPI0028655174|nr:hydrolase 1, exosortase A system-associated [Rheinheimera pacifica]MDR6983601.1 exosortase A-associated hydrolase 1 [Rheinheimera pacifica]
MTEHYISLAGADYQLSAIVHQAPATTGVLLIVGGPQYRVGSHRQFVKLSRYLAAQGVPSMRLDTAGMGDSSGSKAAFYQQTADIELAIDAFFQQCPQLTQVVLWGLCDAASAILIKLNRPDPRISGVILLNPWVRQQQSHAKAMLKHYYLKRLLSRQFWHKLFGGGLALRRSISSFWQTLRASKTATVAATAQLTVTEQNYVAAMLSGWQQFNGKVLLISSGNDLTAQEFLQLCADNPAWGKCLRDAGHYPIIDASHTFSSARWREQVEQQSYNFVQTTK